MNRIEKYVNLCYEAALTVSSPLLSQIIEKADLVWEEMNGEERKRAAELFSKIVWDADTVSSVL